MNMKKNRKRSMAKRYEIKITAESNKLSVIEAAEVLNVSKAFMLDLLDKEEIPFDKTDKNYFVKMEDVMAYKTAIDARRRVILDQIAAESQEFGF